MLFNRRCQQGINIQLPVERLEVGQYISSNNKPSPHQEELAGLGVSPLHCLGEAQLHPLLLCIVLETST
jgi:hypothetical protein